MNVYQRMTKNPVVISPKLTVSKAYQMMIESGYSQLPVVNSDNKLVGLITDELVEKITPDGTSSLSDYEINHLLSKTKIEDIMLTGILSINQSDYIEKAALVMKEQRLRSLPVVDNENNLVGIVTRTDIFKAFIDIMGVKLPGTRLTVVSTNKRGVIAEITGVIADEGADILSITNSSVNGVGEIVIKITALDTTNITEKLTALGYTVKDVCVQR